MLKLIIEDDEGRKTVVPFVRDEITIGRQEGNTIRLTERNVSRRHARLFRQNGHICVEDLGSYNGIRLNGDKISGQTAVAEGDLIQIADYDLSVQNDAATTTQPTTQPNPVHDTMPQQPAQRSELTTIRLDGLTKPMSPVDAPGQTLSDDDGPEEAHPDDVTAAPSSDPAPNAPLNRSTAVIHMDQVEKTRTRRVQDIDPTEAPRLVVLNTEFAGREFACIRTELRVGRTDDNDIAIDHRSLSRTHCKVVREDSGEWRVLDMESANGLMVNGESYAQATLRSGDVIELGHVKVKFVGPGEKFTLSATSDGVKVKTGSKAPLFAVGTVVVVALLGAGYIYTRKPHPSGTGGTGGGTITEVPPVKPPDTVVVEVLKPPETLVVQPDPVKPDTNPPPVVVDPEQVRIAEQVKRNEAIFAKAQEAMGQGDLATVAQLLPTCKVGKSPCPWVEQMNAQMQTEKHMKEALDGAAQAMNEGKLEKATKLLGDASTTEAFKERHAELSELLKEKNAQKMVATKPPEVVKPVVVAPPLPVVPPTAKVSEAGKVLQEARDMLDQKQQQLLPGAKSKLLKCIKIEPGNSDCHRLLGSTFAKLGDSASGVKHYKKFLELDPDHPKADQVRKMVESYEESQKH